MVRIGGGKFKGRIIKTPNTRLTRVSTSYFRKVIFDTLAPYFEGAHVLDLFAGSGSLGIEAISRGASLVYFVDKESKPIKAIKDNIALLDIAKHARVIKKDSFTYLAHHKTPLEVILLDPPYTISTDDLSSILSTIDTNALLNPEGAICLELKTSSAKAIKELKHKSFSMFKEKTKGESTLFFYKSTS